MIYMDKIFIHVDMDAFFAAVEVRDNPELSGKPLIIGAMPNERGVVSTCSYEARKYGIHSAMSIKEAYRRCPNGIYMHPNMAKYKEASDRIHEIWSEYTDLIEYISLDEGYLDMTGSAHLFGDACNAAMEIKQRTKEYVGLTCSVGIGYNMMSAKLSSEEKKPDGFFRIRNAEELKKLIIDRDVRVLLGVGAKTAATLHNEGFNTVRDIYQDPERLIRRFGNLGIKIIDYANGIDPRAVCVNSKAKSIGKEHTFQEDITDYSYLEDALLLTARDLSFEINQKKLYCCTITLKITYGNMKAVTRSKTASYTNQTDDIYNSAKTMLRSLEKKPVRLIGITLSHFSDTASHQLSLLDSNDNSHKEHIGKLTYQIRQRFGKDLIKTGHELKAEKRFTKKDKPK